MIHPDGTMDVMVDGVQKRRKFVIEKRVTRGCITQSIEVPVHDILTEQLTLATGKLPRIETKAPPK